MKEPKDKKESAGQVRKGVFIPAFAVMAVVGVPCTSSKFLYQDVLRDEWRFNGFVVTDYILKLTKIP